MKIVTSDLRNLPFPHFCILNFERARQPSKKNCLGGVNDKKLLRISILRK
jgi:hypothetical protein